MTDGYRFPDRVMTNLPAGARDRIDAMSRELGMTPATYVRVAVLERLRRDEGSEDGHGQQ